MKIATLLTQFLYTNRHLEIPGIGRFSIPEGVAIPEPGDKNFTEFLQSIEFSSKARPQASDELIDYIRSKTGKIKPLAESDLDSFLADCKLLLNIGKPFYFEGIGTLQKGREGVLEFSHGLALSERMESLQSERVEERHSERKPLYPSEMTSAKPATLVLRKLLIMGGIVLGLAVIVWGGYLLYSKKTNNTPEISTQINPGPVQPENPQNASPDSVQPAAKDTIARPPVVTAAPAAGIKFICEITNNKRRAENRIALLKTMNTRYQLETVDSTYKIFVLLPVEFKDTTRAKDSLRAWYWGARNKVIQIEL